MDYGDERDMLEREETTDRKDHEEAPPVLPSVSRKDFF